MGVNPENGLSASVVNGIRPEAYGNATGSDGTSAIQAAVNAAAAIAQTASNGIVDVYFTPGAAYQFGQIIVADGVRLWAYGATLVPIPAQISNLGWIGQTNAGAKTVNRFEVRGGTWTGAGTETFAVVGIPQRGGVADGVFTDMRVTGWGYAPIWLYAPSRCHITNNRLLNLPLTTVNSIDIVFSNVDPQAIGYVIVDGNIITSTAAASGSGGGAIALVEQTATPPASMQIPLTITNNMVQALGNLAGVIDIENAGSGSIFNRVIIAHNHSTALRQAGSYSTAVVVDGAYQDVQIADNSLFGNFYGIDLITVGGAVPAASVTNNRISAAQAPIHGTPVLQTGNRFTATGASQGRAVLVAGTVTVNTAEVQAGDNILLTVVAPAGTRGEVQVGTITAGTSFVINSIQPGTASTLQAADTSTVFWQIVH